MEKVIKCDASNVIWIDLLQMAIQFLRYVQVKSDTRETFLIVLWCWRLLAFNVVECFYVIFLVGCRNQSDTENISAYDDEKTWSE